MIGFNSKFIIQNS